MTNCKAPKLKTFRVTLLEMTHYRFEIEAVSKKAAEAKAHKMWDCGDTEIFTVREVRLDYLDAEEITP